MEEYFFLKNSLVVQIEILGSSSTSKSVSTNDVIVLWSRWLDLNCLIDSGLISSTYIDSFAVKEKEENKIGSCFLLQNKYHRTHRETARFDKESVLESLVLVPLFQNWPARHTNA